MNLPDAFAGHSYRSIQGPGARYEQLARQHARLTDVRQRATVEPPCEHMAESDNG